MDDKRFDPFRRNDKAVTSSVYELVKTVVMFPVMVLRAAFVVLLLFLYSLVCRVATIGLPVDRFEEAWKGGWRRTVLLLGPVLCQLTWIFSLGCWIRVTGDRSYVDKRTGRKAQIIVSNHTSYMDVNAFLATQFPSPGFVAKSTIFGLPMIGVCARVWGCIPVDRDKKAGGNVVEMLAYRDKHPDVNPVVIFPEGTTSNGRYLMHFHRGAFAAGAPVKPVILHYPFENFSPSWESITFPQHMVRFLTQFVNYCELQMLPVYVPSEKEVADASLYAHNVREVMAKAGGLKISDSELKDKKDYLELIRGVKGTVQ